MKWTCKHVAVVTMLRQHETVENSDEKKDSRDQKSSKKVQVCVMVNSRELHIHTYIHIYIYIYMCVYRSR